jgi:hypothetical protein
MMRGSSRTPPAPLCDSTTSWRLDQTGQRVEQVRNILQIAGHGCLTPHVTTPCVLAGWLRCETGQSGRVQDEDRAERLVGDQRRYMLIPCGSVGRLRLELAGDV